MKGFLGILIMLIAITHCDSNSKDQSKVINQDIDRSRLMYDSIHKIVSYLNHFSEGIDKVNDSVLIDLFMKGKYQEIINKKIKLDSDTAIGIVSVSNLRLGRNTEALNSLKHFNQSEFKISLIDSTIMYPREYPSSMGIYEKWALYHLLFLKTDDRDLRVNAQQLLSSDLFYYKRDTLKGVDIVRADYMVFNEKLYPGTDSIPFKYIKSMKKKYSFWKELDRLEDSIVKYMRN